MWRVSEEDFIGSEETDCFLAGLDGSLLASVVGQFSGRLPKNLPLWIWAFNHPPPPPSDLHCSLLTSSTHSSHPSIHPCVPSNIFVPLILFPPTTLSITTSHYLCSLRKERKNWGGLPESLRGRIKIRVGKWKHPNMHTHTHTLNPFRNPQAETPTTVSLRYHQNFHK